MKLECEKEHGNAWVCIACLSEQFRGGSDVAGVGKLCGGASEDVSGAFAGHSGKRGWIDDWFQGDGDDCGGADESSGRVGAITASGTGD